MDSKRLSISAIELLVSTPIGEHHQASAHLFVGMVVVMVECVADEIPVERGTRIPSCAVHFRHYYDKQ